MDDSLWKQLTEFTRQEVGGRPLFGKEPMLTPATELFEDLHIDGDDAIEFLEKWFDTFNVAGIENFPVNRYFGGEGMPLGTAILILPILLLKLFCALFRIRPPSDVKHQPLTLGMLYEAARVGRWDTEAIEASQRPQSQI